VQFTIGKELERGVASKPISVLGAVIGGPISLLSWLESQLGLQAPTVSFTARMVPYLNCLREYDDGSRFYSASLAKDEFGVAGALLNWRDTWYEAGWDGDGFEPGASQRLLDMAEVEKAAADRVPQGLGQRVQRVLAALDDARLDVEVTLLDPPDVFPNIWRQLFAALGARTEACALQSQCPGDSDLAVLQRALLDEDREGDEIELRGDGTVVVLRDGSPQLSAAWIGRYAHRQLGGGAEVAVLASDEGATLDDALADAGFPRLGFSDTSYWRPAFQVLPLVLELMWRPLDPKVLQQFLTHPMGPIPSDIRRRLADRVAREPGIGGDGWKTSLSRALDQATKGLDDQAGAERRKELVERIDYWLNGERFDAEQGVDVEVLRERAQAVSRWLNAARNAEKDDGLREVYTAALGQADELDRTFDRLAETGTTALNRESVRRLVEAVRGTGTSRPGRHRQCEPGVPELLRANTPAAFLEPVEQVIWWGCDRVRLPGQYPWSGAEQTLLAAHGVQLVPVDAQLEWQAKSWLRPLLAASKRLVIVLHDNIEGHHPVFDEIIAVAKGWAEERVDRLMRDPARLPIADHLPPTQTVEQMVLPRKQRWWQLPDGVTIDKRDEESFSSLERFLHSPYRWVLDYQARIREGALSELSDGPLLFGNLTHTMFETYFNLHPDIQMLDRDAAAAWVRAEAPRLIEEKGAVLTVPGRQADVEDFIAMAATALCSLVERLQQADIVQVEMETEIKGSFGGGRIKGTIDLIATRADGELAVIDLKWGRFNDRQKMLRDSSYLQLGVYAQLIHQDRGKWPTLGYFIISDARLVVLDSNFFPGVTSEQPVNGESVLQFWQRVEATWKWRRAQLDRGLIEVSVTDTEPDEGSDPGDAGLPLPPTDDKYDIYMTLTGWGDKE
jgi:RecB family exonuclease